MPVKHKNAYLTYQVLARSNFGTSNRSYLECGIVSGYDGILQWFADWKLRCLKFNFRLIITFTLNNPCKSLLWLWIYNLLLLQCISSLFNVFLQIFFRFLSEKALFEKFLLMKFRSILLTK